MRINNYSLHPSSTFHQWLYSPFLGPGLFFSFVIFFTQMVGLLGRVIIRSQGCYPHTGQHKHRTDTDTHTDNNALSRIRTHDPSVQVSEGSSCLRPRDDRDRLHPSWVSIFSWALSFQIRVIYVRPAKCEVTFLTHVYFCVPWMEKEYWDCDRARCSRLR
jgi:hypothetical protein